MENKANSSDFRVIDNYLHFNAVVARGVGVTMESLCAICPVVDACFGEIGLRYKKAKVKLDYPKVTSLTPSEAQKIPCGAGIEIIARSPHK